MHFEEKYILNQFKLHFSHLKNNNFVFYGIGNNTKTLIENLNGFNIKGLLDASTTGKVIYGLKVLDFCEVVSLSPIIVIVARPSVINLIYNRIAFLENEYAIPIYNINGKRIKGTNTNMYNDDNPYWSIDSTSLKESIDEHDVISFDIFDTLIMRKTYLPSDVFYIVEDRIFEKYNIKIPFVEARINSIITCESQNPTLEDIYESIQKILCLTDELKENIKKLEIQVEQEVCVPRTTMVDLYNYALKIGKVVYLSSDMYLPINQIKLLLEQSGIKDYHYLLISCQENMSKETGQLYEIILQKEKGRRILHIGDNEKTDVYVAKQKGLDVFFIASAAKILELSSMNHLMVNVSTFEERLMLGLFISEIFNNPFVLYARKGRLKISEYQTFAYLFIAPYVAVFFSWFVQNIRRDKIETIIFGSRDGYLFYNIYEHFKAVMELPKSIYLRISKRMISTPALFCKEDINNLLNVKFHGSNKNLFSKRFGIDINDEDSDSNIETLSKNYENEILSQAAYERENYKRYWNSLGINENAPIGFFDFISIGTIQHYLQKVINRPILGYYFGVRRPTQQENYNNIQSKSLIANQFSFYEMEKNLIKYHHVLESIFSSPEASVIYIDKNDKFNYYNEIRTERFINGLVDMHKAILKFVFDYAALDHQFFIKELSIKYADDILGCLSKLYIDISESIYKDFVWEDVYSGITKIDLANSF